MTAETKIRILVAEDNLLIAKDICSTLEEGGYEIISVVDNGKDAIRAASDSKPDLIIMDIMLKGKLNGIEAAESIRRNLEVPIVFLSGLTDDETLLNAYFTKPAAYLTKPFRRAELLRKISKVFKTAG